MGAMPVMVASAETSVARGGAAAEGPVVRVRGLGKRFRIFASPGDRLWYWVGLGGVLGKPAPEEFWAVRDVSFTLAQGECLGVIGANGSGKSTLLKVLTGALRPTEGEFEVRGRVLSLIELGTGLNPVLTGRQNIHHAATLLGFPADYARSKMNEIEAFAELGEFFDRQINVYSSGMRVRLAFSMFACFQPDLFIIDEALSVGDVFFQQKCIQRLRAMMDDGLTMLFVSHDQSAILNLCDRAIVMSHGRVAFEGKPEEAVSRYVSALRGGNRYAGSAAGSAGIGGHRAGPAPAGAEEQVRAIREHDVIGARGSQRHGTGMLQVEAARVLDGQGRDTLQAAVGQSLVFELLLHARGAVGQPRCGVRLYDRFNNLVFGGGTSTSGVALPAMAAGDRLIVRLVVTMDVELGEYTFGLGAGEPDPENPSAGVHHDRVELLGPISVHLPEGASRTFFGMARLPMAARVVMHVPGGAGS